LDRINDCAIAAVTADYDTLAAVLFEETFGENSVYGLWH
jgi:hypothetical protein